MAASGVGGKSGCFYYFLLHSRITLRATETKDYSEVEGSTMNSPAKTRRVLLADLTGTRDILSPWPIRIINPLRNYHWQTIPAICIFH